MDGARAGPYRLRLAGVRRTPMSGWRRFELILADAGGDYRPAAIDGLYSAGGRGVAPWIEVLAYRPRVLRDEARAELAGGAVEVALFRHLAALLPPGGHLMLGCDGAAHEDTHRALMRGVPPAATPLGLALLAAGLPRIRFFGLPEGGWEGQQKLFAERPMDPEMDRAWRARTAGELRGYMAAAPPGEELELARMGLGRLGEVERPGV